MIPIRRLAELDVQARRTLLLRPDVVTQEVLAAVRAIVSDVRARGDDAVRAYSEKFDKVRLASIEVGREEWDAGEKKVTQQEQVAIRSAFENLTRFHRQGLLKSFEYSPVKGILLGTRVVPYARAGLYVPGGLTRYPSCVLMTAVPAAVAGVREIMLCTPPGPDGTLPATVLHAARVAGVHRIFKVGGAQAIAALAYGTAAVPRVEILVGPGNRYVTAAKKLLSEFVAVDFLAGPTELLVLSDGNGNPRYIASDLVAQAEHDPDARSILVTTDPKQAEAVAQELAVQARVIPRFEIAQKALAANGAILVADTLPKAIAFVNDYGPEHLIIACDHPRDVMDEIRHAGAIFLGDMSPVAVGDYGVGPNSTLPTLGGARRFSGLSANTFTKTISFEFLTRDGLMQVAPVGIAMAKMESLDGHRASIEIRQPRRELTDARSGSSF
ncbi:MAG: histidinol dehydrogenase [Planctomycetes bacterium]|nr:histidinol dehydrogenase [Planctomycetota bacterium]